MQSIGAVLPVDKPDFCVTGNVSEKGRKQMKDAVTAAFCAAAL